jgi:uncharacterized membrane protein YczE
MLQDRVYTPDAVSRRLALVIASLLIVGLAVGLAVDLGLGTRPFATLVLSLAAAQLAALLVYRSVAASLRRISDNTDSKGQV